MELERWQALGNEYLIVERERLRFELGADGVRALCDDLTGLGADGVLELSHGDDDAVSADLTIWNSDGSQAELSGNGTRQAFLYLRASGWADSNSLAIRTPAGIITAELTGPDSATVELGRATTASSQFPEGPADGRAEVEISGRVERFQFVSVGNPQCVFEVASPEQLDALDIGAIGPLIEHDSRFPGRTNVSWWTAIDERKIRARIFERGVGETASSGTGASGAAVASVLAGGSSPVTVALDGGELLVEVDDAMNVALSGTANCVERIRVSGELLDRVTSL
ncbi:MAG: diaminopimelate epimerase [Solirubrobacteraceae bacterium]|nr:diaminopimelate epimerase [Solirubrobacteraceae bacterium]